MKVEITVMCFNKFSVQMGQVLLRASCPLGFWTTQSVNGAQSVTIYLYYSYVPEAKEQMLDKDSQAIHTLLPSGRVYMKGKHIARTSGVHLL